MGFITSYQPEPVVSRIGIFIHDDSVAFEVNVTFDSVLLIVSFDTNSASLRLLISGSIDGRP
jgi:hypothetical protein